MKNIKIKTFWQKLLELNTLIFPFIILIFISFTVFEPIFIGFSEKLMIFTALFSAFLRLFAPKEKKYDLNTAFFIGFTLLLLAILLFKVENDNILQKIAIILTIFTAGTIFAFNTSFTENTKEKLLKPFKTKNFQKQIFNIILLIIFLLIIFALLALFYLLVFDPLLLEKIL